jgi:hypothetical protein
MGTEAERFIQARERLIIKHHLDHIILFGERMI